MSEPSSNTILRPGDGQGLAFLDGLRGLAAFYVLIHHARWLVWEGFSSGYVLHPDAYSLPGRLLAYASIAFNYGHQAVLFFFVLSGFVIHLRYATALKESPDTAKFDWWPFMVRRFKRIYPAFLFAVILTFVLDNLGLQLGFPIYAGQTPYSLINLNMHPDYSLNNAVRTLLFVDSPPGVPSWGINGPLWSLKIEWWFYLLYPVFWWLSRRSIQLATVTLAVLFGLTFISAIWVLPFTALLQSVFTWMLVWWFGALLADMYTGRSGLRLERVALLSLLFLCLPLLISPIVELSTGVADFLWGLGFFGLLAAFLTFHKRGVTFGWAARLKPLGNVSYTLYVSHFPVLTFIGGWLMSQNGDHVLPAHFGWIVWSSLICLIVAYLAHFVVEKPFVRKRATPVPVTRY